MSLDASNSRRNLETENRTPDIEYRLDDDERLSRAVVVAISDAEERDVAEVPPLHGTIDLDALDSLFRPTYDGAARASGRVTFVHGICEVVVEPERVRVYRDANGG